MNKLLLLIILLLSSCQTIPAKKQTCSHPLEYSLWVEHQIAWDGVFQQAEEHYYVYFYSPICGFCEKIKQTMLCFYLNAEETMYVIGDTGQMSFGLHENEGLIGINTLTDFCISGTPTLIFIVKGEITHAWVGAKSIEEKLTS